jgi:hypothetical protein
MLVNDSDKARVIHTNDIITNEARLDSRPRLYAHNLVYRGGRCDHNRFIASAHKLADMQIKHEDSSAERWITRGEEEIAVDATPVDELPARATPTGGVSAAQPACASGKNIAVSPSHHASLVKSRSVAVETRAKNLWTRCQGLSKKSKWLLQANFQENRLRRHKQEFGTKYLNLVARNGATPGELTECTETAVAEMNSLQTRIQELRVLARQEEVTSRYIIQQRIHSIDFDIPTAGVPGAEEGKQACFMGAQAVEWPAEASSKRESIDARS